MTTEKEPRVQSLTLTKSPLRSKTVLAFTAIGALSLALEMAPEVAAQVEEFVSAPKLGMLLSIIAILLRGHTNSGISLTDKRDPLPPFLCYACELRHRQLMELSSAIDQDILKENSEKLRERLARANPTQAQLIDEIANDKPANDR